MQLTNLTEAGVKISNLTKEAIKTVNYNGYGPANATGRAAESIGFVLTDRSLQIVSDGEPANYVMTLVDGRGPTTSNGDGSLRRKIREWLDVKNIGQDSQRDGMSYAIAKTIHKEGNTLFRKGGNSPIFDALLSDEVLDMVADAAAIDVWEQL